MTMKLDFLKNQDGTTSVFGEKTEKRGSWSGVVATLKPVDGGVIIMKGMSEEPIACRPNMVAAAEYVRREAR